MAEKALQKVEDELTTCSICLDTFINPKLLQCFHVYCQGCLKRLIVRDQQGQLVLTCPNCRQVTPIPADGVASIQSAFHINHLLGIMKEHKQRKLCCSEHADEEVRLYCKACGELVCYKCVIRGGKHQSHNYELLDEAFKKYKKEIGSSLRPVEKQMETINQALAQLDTRCVDITNQQAIIEVNIHSTIGRLQEILDNRRIQLIDQLNQITQSKLKSLASQKDQLKTIQSQLGSCLDFVKKSMETNQHDLMNIEAEIVKQVKELTTPIQPDLLKPCAEADLLYSGSSDTFDKCQNYGRLSGPSFLNPSKCYVTGYGLEIASMKEKSSAILHAIDYAGKPCVQPISSLECKLISEIAGTRVLGRVNRVEQSKYEISYQPIVTKRHYLHIKVEGQHIRGSPFNVAVVKSSIKKIGSFNYHTTAVYGPHSIALDHEQKLIVSGVQDHSIQVFNPKENKQMSFPTHGQLRFPMGVAVDSKGNILVVDSGHNRVVKFAAKGRLLTVTNARGRKRFNNPYGIAFNMTNNKVYVTDTYNHRVQVLNFDLTFFSSFGIQGNGKGQFAYPQGITCDSAGNVYVVENSNHRLQVFTAEGEFLKVVGGGELNFPSNVAIDTNGLVYITEVNNHRVSVFTPEGQFVKVFGEYGREPGQFIHPRGIVVDGNGVIHVCDTDNDRFQTFGEHS